MKHLLGIILIFFHLHAYANPADIQPNELTIDKNAFAGFEKCHFSKELSKIIENAHATIQPLKKERGVFTYAVKSEIFGIPVSKMQIGVCDNNSRDCGWAAYVCLNLDSPLAATRKRLKELTGNDFTKQLRDKEVELTLRPVLSKATTRNSSLLFCDPGIL